MAPHLLLDSSACLLQMRFMPTNFTRPKHRADSSSEGGAPSTSVSLASKEESAFEDLVKAAKSEATWQRPHGRGAGGRGPSRAVTAFGGGAGEAQADVKRVKEEDGGGGGGGEGGGFTCSR